LLPSSFCYFAAGSRSDIERGTTVPIVDFGDYQVIRLRG